MSWTDDKLIIKDPKDCPHNQKRHIDELIHSTEEKEIDGVKYIVSKNLKEIDPLLNNLVHRAVEYCYASPFDENFNKMLGRTILGYGPIKPFKNIGRWLIDEELTDSPTAIQIEEAEDVRMVSKIKDPDQAKGPMMTPLNSTFVTAGYVNFIREAIEWLRNYRTCQTMHALLEKEREKFLCPVCGEYDIYPQELYCYRAYYYDGLENQGEWYKDIDNEWDIFTWANPFLHAPLTMDLDREYEVETTKIYFRNHQALWKFVRWIVPEGLTKKDLADWEKIEFQEWNIPKDSYLFFDNHFTRYKVSLNRSIRIGDDGYYGDDVLGDIDNPNFWMEISPALKFDVKEVSKAMLSQFKVKAKALKETTIIEVDLSNAFFFDLADWLEHPESGTTFMWKLIGEEDDALPYYHSLSRTLDKFLSPQTQIKFQGHNKVYTVKKTDRNLTGANPFSASIELTEKLAKDVGKEEAIFLYSFIKAKHIEEIRTALDNLKTPPSFEYRTWTGPQSEECKYNAADIENCESTVTHVSTTEWEYVAQTEDYERQRRTRTYDYDHHCIDPEALRAYSTLDGSNIPAFADRNQCLIDEGKKGTTNVIQYRHRDKVGGVWQEWIYETGTTKDFERVQGIADGVNPAYKVLGLTSTNRYALLYYWWHNNWFRHTAPYDLQDDDQIPLKGTRLKATVDWSIL